MADQEIQNAVIRHVQRDMAAVPGASQRCPVQPSLTRVIWESLKNPDQYSVLWAEWRRGLKDLQQVVLNPFPQGHVAQHEEPGSIASPTQLEVYREKHAEIGPPEVFGRETSYMDQLAQAARRGPERDQGISR